MSAALLAQPPERNSSKDDEGRQRLLAEQLPSVRCIALRIHGRLPRHFPLEDLINAGVVGLIDASQKFDSRKHVQFGSYAKSRIRDAILDSLRELDWSPRDWRLQARRIEEAHNKVRSGLGRSPTESELASELQAGSWLLLFTDCCDGLPYVDDGAAAYESRYRQHRIGRLAATAKELGYQLTPVAA
jgi:RNA polymerase sigma factor (sigma-70 family)